MPFYKDFNIIITVYKRLCPNPLALLTVLVKYKSVSGLKNAKAPDWNLKP